MATRLRDKISPPERHNPLPGSPKADITTAAGSGDARRRQVFSAVRLFLLLVATGLLAALYQSWIRIPANVAPWGEVDLDRPPSLLARLQINSLAADPPACLAAL